MVAKTIKTSLCASLIACCILGFSLPEIGLCAEAVSVKNDLLSASVRDTSLLEVARDIQQQSGVWFRGDETLFQEKISVSFTDLPMEEGLKRILTNLNYSFIYDAKNKIAGVVVMGQGKLAGTQTVRPGAQLPRVATPPATTRPAPAVRSRPSTSRPPPATVRRLPRASPQIAPGGAPAPAPGSSAAQSPLPDAFRSHDNVSTPGEPLVSDSPLPPAFRVMENAPPPGGPVPDKVTPDAARPAGSATPASGTPQATAAGPSDSKPGANAQSTGDATKSDSAP